MKRLSKPKLKAGDTVQVLTGIDRGKKGKVLQVFPQERTIVVEGVNRRSKGVRPRQQGQKGEIVQFNAPLKLDNLILVCPHCHKKTRVRMTTIEKGKKQRTCRQCQQPIDK